MVESGRRLPTLDLARALDEALATHGTFERLQQFARTAPLPAWFRPWAEIEAAASQLRLAEHSLIPGLFQTEDYARAVRNARPAIQARELDELVAARVARQMVLTREGGPPLVWALIDESTLTRMVGGTKLMHEQLLRLAELNDCPHISIQVLPLAIGVHHGLAGGFAIAHVDGAGAAAYLAFDSLRSEALPCRATTELIRKRAWEYGSD
jgi:hypothetical protein